MYCNLVMLCNVNAQCDVNIAIHGNGNKNVITGKKKNETKKKTQKKTCDLRSNCIGGDFLGSP